MTQVSSPAPTAPPATERAQLAASATDTERLKAATQGFVADFSPQVATFMEACIHCGHCAEACQFYTETGDPRYTPIHKLEPFKQVYKRNFGPFAWFYRMFDLKPEVTLRQLADWQDLIFDSCNMCGRCTLACPMGIDIADLVEKARHGMFEAGLTPSDYLGALAQKEAESGSPFGMGPEALRAAIAAIAADHGIDIPVDLPQAEVVPTVSSIDVKYFPEAIAATAKVLNRIGRPWSFQTAGFDADNVSLTAGDRQGQAEVTRRIVTAAQACGARILLMPECGHSYTEMRWEAANIIGRPLEFRILHMVEFLAEALGDGSLRVSDAGGDCTFHDPCQVTRRGGRGDAPRTVLTALGITLHELPDWGDEAVCCGGGGGVALIGRAKPLRNKIFELKMRQVEATGQTRVCVACAGCRQSFLNGAKTHGWDREIVSLTELVADHLAAEPQT